MPLTKGVSKKGESVTSPLVPLLGNLHPPFLYIMVSSPLSPLLLTLSQDLYPLFHWAEWGSPMVMLLVGNPADTTDH